VDGILMHKIIQDEGIIWQFRKCSYTKKQYRQYRVANNLPDPLPPPSKWEFISKANSFFILMKAKERQHGYFS
jgi:hypothetical protein